MRDFEFRQRQAAKRKRWAKEIVSRWRDPESPEARREVGRIATTHTFCGCITCRWPKLAHIPTLQDRRSTDAASDSLHDNGLKGRLPPDTSPRGEVGELPRSG